MEKLKKYLPSILVLLYGGLVSFTKSPFIGDANVFINIKGSIITAVISRYFQWTSRVLIESVLLFVLRSYNGILWIILNILIIFLLYISLKKIFNSKNEIYINYIIMSLIILYTYTDMFSAGWSASTVNYLWPLALGIFSFIPIINILNNNNKTKKVLFLAIPALIFAVNQEQAAALIFGFSILSLIYYYIKNKKINYIILVYILISLIGIIFALTCPGNINRLNAETINWFNDYSKLTIIDKTLLSLNNTFDILLSRINYIGILFYSIITYYHIKNKNKIYSIISIILTIGTILIPFTNVFNLNYLYNLNHSNGINVIPLLKLNSTNYILSIIISVIYLISTILLLYKIKDNRKRLLCPIIYMASILSRMIIGFSPTLFASSYRTGIFMNFLIGMNILLLFKEIKPNKKEKLFITISIILLIIVKFIISCVK